MKSHKFYFGFLVLFVGLGLAYRYFHPVSSSNPPPTRSFQSTSDQVRENLKSAIPQARPSETVEEKQTTSEEETPRRERGFASVDVDYGARQPAETLVERLGISEPTAQEKALPLTEKHFRLVPGVWAVPSQGFPSQREDIQRLETVSGFSLFRSEDGKSAKELKAYPVAYDDQKKTLGIVTGEITMTLKQYSRTRDIERDFGLIWMGGQERVGLAFFRTERRDPEELKKLLTALRGDSRIQRADLSIVSQLRTPK